MRKEGEKIGEAKGDAKRLQAVVINSLQSDLYKNGTITITQVAKLGGNDRKVCKTSAQST